MTSIDLVVRALAENSQPPDCVVPFIDGHDLVELITEYEMAEGYEPVGGYDGIVPTSFTYGPLLAYYLGARGDGYWGKVGKIALLGCSCGEVGCWPLYVHVHASATEVHWSAFEQPHRPDRTYNGFGPFTFDRRQYERSRGDQRAASIHPATSSAFATAHRSSVEADTTSPAAVTSSGSTDAIQT